MVFYPLWLAQTNYGANENENENLNEKRLENINDQ